MSRIDYVTKNKIHKFKKKVKDNKNTDKKQISMLLSELEKAYMENAKLKMKMCGDKDVRITPDPNSITSAPSIINDSQEDLYIDKDGQALSTDQITKN